MTDEIFGYRIGAVQSMKGFQIFDPVKRSYFKRKYIKDCVINGRQYHPFCNLSMFSLKIVKRALKQLKQDYPHQRFQFGKFPHDGKVFLAIQPERPTPPDQWMIIAPTEEVET